MRRLHAIVAFVLASGLVSIAPAQEQKAVPVTVDNFVRAETDMYFDLFARRGGLGKFVHSRELPLENTGVRPNRDSLYSEAVFDLDAGITAAKNSDGSVDVQFGGCDGKIPNCIPIVKGWNYTVRLYRPRAEILDGRWKFPVAQPVD